MDTSENKPLVSTVTPVLNGEKYISENLASLKAQTYPNVEIIVVDNFSQDRTVEIANEMGVTVYLKGPERASQDNYGVEMARGKYVFITGCDMAVDLDYIEKCVEKCEKEGYDAIYASVKSRTWNYWSRVKGLERDLYIGDDAHEAARFFRREVYLKLGGFDASLVLHADDYDMQRKLDAAGYKTGRIDSYEEHIDEIDSLREVFFKSFYYGLHSWEYMKRYKGSAITQLSPVRGVFFKKYKMLLAHPLLAAGMVVFKVVQYASATTGLVFSMLGLERVGLAFHKRIYAKK